MRLRLPDWLDRLNARSWTSFSLGVRQQLAESLAGVSSYHPFTRDFDRVTSVSKIESILGPLSDEAHQETERAWSKLDLLAPTLRERARPIREKIVEHVAAKGAILPPHFTVSILIDLSGSMRGNGIHLAAAVVDTCNTVLVELGIATEILGFTTTGWHGGLSRRQWNKLGRPQNPGRLCDLLHIIFGTADGSEAFELKQMFRADLYHENVDGEAVEWALSRLTQRPEGRKVLLVVSDGVPSDDSTHKASGLNYLATHLLGVLAETRQKADIAIAAIGIGYDPTSLYGDAITVADAEELPAKTLGLLTKLLPELAFADKP